MSVTDPDLSVFSWMVKGLHVESIQTQVAVFLPLGYEALVAYSTLFRLQLFHYYRLIPHQQTDAFSIMFSASYLCRLAAPLSYNFMNFLHDQLEFSSFEVVMGKVDVVPFLGRHFNVYFPILIGVVCLATLFNVYSRIAACFKIKRFRFDEKFSDTKIDEGRSILQRERHKLSTNETLPLTNPREEDSDPPVLTVTDDLSSHIDSPDSRESVSSSFRKPFFKGLPSMGGGVGSNKYSPLSSNTAAGDSKRSFVPVPGKKPGVEVTASSSEEDDKELSFTARWLRLGKDRKQDEKNLLPQSRRGIV